MNDTEPQYLADLRDGKTLHTLHVATGGHQSFQWDESKGIMFVHSWNEKNPERGATTDCENWYMGTLQLPFRKKHDAFRTNY